MREREEKQGRPQKTMADLIYGMIRAHAAGASIAYVRNAYRSFATSAIRSQL